MLEVKNLTVSTPNGRDILKDVSFILNDGDKLAVIGEEGNGKSTLLKAIYDKKLLNFFAVSGEINKGKMTCGLLEQILDEEWNNFTAIDFFLKNTPKSEQNYEIYNDFGKISQIISNLNLDEEILEGRRIGTMSGGEKVKLQLAKLWYQNPDLVLLDEPTNDLDIETLELLEDYIQKNEKIVVYVSHDETLLERTANCILHLEQIKHKSEPRFTFANLSYRDYVDERILKLAKQDQIATFEQARRREQKEIVNNMRNKLQSVNPGRANAMRAILAREARWEREGLTEHTDTEEQISLRYTSEVKLPARKVVLNLHLDKLAVGDKLLAQDVNLLVTGPEKVVIIGKNGCGKSSLIKEIYRKLYSEPLPGIKFLYMPQNYGDLLDENLTPIEFLCDSGEKKDIELIRTILGNLKFTSKEMEHKIGELSGGQKAKVYLTKIMREESNVLLLDEPTRNLSPLSNPAIRQFFKNYKGAIISVSHDRKFIGEVCDKVYRLDQSGLKRVDF